MARTPSRQVTSRSSSSPSSASSTWLPVYPRKSLDSGGRSYGRCVSSPITTTGPVYPCERSDRAVDSPARDAPTITTRPGAALMPWLLAERREAGWARPWTSSRRPCRLGDGPHGCGSAAWPVVRRLLRCGDRTARREADTPPRNPPATRRPGMRPGGCRCRRSHRTRPPRYGRWRSAHLGCRDSSRRSASPGSMAEREQAANIVVAFSSGASQPRRSGLSRVSGFVADGGAQYTPVALHALLCVIRNSEPSRLDSQEVPAENPTDPYESEISPTRPRHKPTNVVGLLQASVFCTT